MSDLVDLKISQHAVRKYADEVRELERQLKERDKIIEKLDKKITELRHKDYGPPYGPHNPTGNQ